MTTISDTSNGAGADPVGAVAESLPAALAHWAKTRGDERAVTFVDYSGDPAGVIGPRCWPSSRRST
ncbi:hypothetical protein [Amycolatopsis anabasis]|uniref:hypothetical protein n=1 Tax=Amycolatopsis anabasis TaxID=1840409 RepID=UPI00131AF7E0|nr:hypothetical protein [Amycolatopsis anabasis]